MKNLKMSSLQQYIQSIENKGYTLIRGVLMQSEYNKLLKQIQDIDEFVEKPSIDKVPYLNRGHKMLYNLQNKSLDFIKVGLSNKLVKQILMHFLNDKYYKGIPEDSPNYILRSMIARSGGPEVMPLHIDSMIPYLGEHVSVMQVAFMLEDSTQENGCTLVVPMSHQSGKYADQEKIKTAIAIEAKAGDVVMWDSRLWHSALGNQSKGTRWAFISTFSRWYLKQMYNFKESLPKSFYEHLTDEELSILGFCSIPPCNEFDRIDIKGGYELLDIIRGAEKKKLR